jgi:hypothetical protein
MTGRRGLLTLAVLALSALPHIIVRGRAARGEVQYYGCGMDGCTDITERTPDRRAPRYCEPHDEPMVVPVVQRWV